MQRVGLKIDGMGCGACIRKVSNALGTVPGVKVELVEIGSATVACDPAVTPVDAIIRALGNAGYPARKEVEHDHH